MSTFQEFELAVERVAVAALRAEERFRILDEGRFLTPAARAALLQAAEELAACAERAGAFKQPRDVIDDEWAEPALLRLRGAMATVAHTAAQPPRDVRDWAHDVRLALGDFTLAKARFDTEIER